MPITIAVGAQWGDEGKGRMVDMLAGEVDFVARYNGGDNAGHTVTVGDKIFKLHLIPSGITHPGVMCIMGNGMVINPATFLDEVQTLIEAGIEISPEHLAISHAAHLITPAHRLLDQAQEEARSQGDKIGTTGRGIGPAYVDKAARRGLRVGDLLNEETFWQKLRAHLQETNLLLQALYHKTPMDIDSISEEYAGKALTLATYIRDIGALLRDGLKQGRHLLAEAAQGTLLDLDHGTYPFVTSSCTTAIGVFSGLGIGIQPVERVIGISKAFQTRVGAGPFPTELAGNLAERLRGTGANPWDEFGTTTGRPRRVGWLDSVLLRFAVNVNGITELGLTKLDILTGMPSIKICTAYHICGEKVVELPMCFGTEQDEDIEPVYDELPGWQQDVRKARRWEELPLEAQRFIGQIEELSGVPVKTISVGPERSQVIIRS